VAALRSLRRGRIIDLSAKAAEALGIKDCGIAEVIVSAQFSQFFAKRPLDNCRTPGRQDIGGHVRNYCCPAPTMARAPI
jgi:rare lipoprotein A (peptidoglycan hydrolase)